jgi:hypothetical protein
MKLKKLLNIVYIFLFITVAAYADEDLNKSFKKFQKDIDKINNSISKLPKTSNKEALIIDSALKEINAVTNYVSKNLKIENQEDILNGLVFIDQSLGDISKILPKEITREVSEKENNNIDKNSISTMMKISSSMKQKKSKKNAELLLKMNKLENKGIKVYEISKRLNDIGVSSLDFDEIANAIKNSSGIIDKESSERIINNLKDSGKDLAKIASPITTPSRPVYTLIDPNQDRVNDFATARTLQHFDFSNEKNGYRITVGKSVDEALEIQKKVYEAAKAYGIDEQRSLKLAKNSYTAYYDMWFHGTEVSEQARNIGRNWDEADKAVEEWIKDSKNPYHQWAINFWGPLDSTKSIDDNDYLPDSGALKKWFDSIGNGPVLDWEPSEDRLDQESLARTYNYLDQDFYNNQTSESNPYTEADEIYDIVYKRAINSLMLDGTKKFTEEEAKIIGKNASSAYLDVWFDATKVMERVLAAGKSYTEADAAVEEWAKMHMDSPAGKYYEWVRNLWAEKPEDPDKDWLPNSDSLDKWFEKLQDTKIESISLLSKDREEYEIGMLIIKNGNINYNDKTQQWEGEPFNEAEDVSQKVYDQAIKFGYSAQEAKKFKKNAYNSYVDTWFEGDEVWQTEKFYGATDKEADIKTEEWYDKSRYNGYWQYIEDKWGISWDFDENGKLIIKKDSSKALALQLKQATNYKQHGYKTAMDEKTYRVGKIKSNFTLANVMNSFTDNQIAGLVASGAINQKLIDEYLTGQKINLNFDINQLTNNTSRQMGFTEVSNNIILSKVLNSMSDQQVYELLASGTIDSDLVNKYIQDGANAPILPCGSSDCEMFPDAGGTKLEDVTILTEDMETPEASDFQELTKDIADLTKEELVDRIDEINQASNDLMQTIAGIDGAVPEDLAAAAAAAGAARDAADAEKSKQNACNANPDEC